MTEPKPEEKKEKNEFKDDTLRQLEECRKKSEEYLNGWKRAKADYINYKKEKEKEFIDLVKFANAGLILELLPILNNFKEARKHLPKELENSEWVKGVFSIKRQLKDMLKNLGIEEIRTVGEKFDPAMHEAVAEEVKEGIPAGQIIEEVKPGYKLHEKVIQAAKVKVAK
ncbi:nucleotide exchange factor GrpE [Candidatus Parcubacteria bacterium]|nr:MAG: nucleotide exchange factor GrpE [Candidatus Parcubacteria bacterium]